MAVYHSEPIPLSLAICPPITVPLKGKALLQPSTSTNRDGLLIAAFVRFSHISAWLVVDVPAQDSAEIQITVELYNKTATRLPEALWVEYNPLTNETTTDTTGEIINISMSVMKQIDHAMVAGVIVVGVSRLAHGDSCW